MGFYEKYIVPRIINVACATKPVMHQRRKVVPQAEGCVLEIGIGNGINLEFYDPSRVKRVIGLDPSEESWKMAGKRTRNLPFDIEFIGLPGEKIPLEKDSVDTVLVTYALCTIPDPYQALESMRRVLRPGGKLVFCEHGLAPDEKVQRWQNRINPVWNTLFGGCNLNRKIPSLLQESGFKVDNLESMYLPGTPKIAGFNYWGVASPA